MKAMLLGCMAVLAMSMTQWEPDFTTAKKKAADSQRLLLLNFSGSDWCIPCIRMHKDVFENNEFAGIADSLLVLYNADFPRKKKNELTPMIRKQNDSLAALYNPEGKFPFTLLLSPDGKVLQQWEGYPEGGLPAFIATIKKTAYANSH
jgi:thioredoxin-related protein